MQTQPALDTAAGRSTGVQRSTTQGSVIGHTWNSLLDRTWLSETPLITPAMSSFMSLEPRGNWSTLTRTGPCLRLFWPVTWLGVPVSGCVAALEGSVEVLADLSAWAGSSPACSAACLASGAADEELAS